MRNSKRGTHIWAVCFAAALSLFTAYVLLDAFVIVRGYTRIEDTPFQALAEAIATDTPAEELTAVPAPTTASTPAITSTSYSGDGISVTLSEYRQNDTTIHVADVTLSNAYQLKTAFAQDTYGQNVTETVAEMSADHDAVLAINGDYYGAQRKGYVIRNGVVYRERASDSTQEDLCVWADGSLSVVNEGDYTAQELADKGALQVFSFGPGLVSDGKITVIDGEETDRARASNPRTAIAMITPLHYLFIVSDGRTADDAGLSLYQLAEFAQSLGAQVAYNLDGGGSSTMVFGGEIINFPTSNGKYKEREVSDIVYIG